ncbi:carboxypeptidase-like regulatory domain-containing protein [uncultured Dokdonia sp.]|uniref:carboxypeptidase-like regulatory domain-containing protein n=1 Tax=uncultured Dokdonia sp. TaxID=575653 RepID=UPI00260428A7|nr:carboxypeptidase-like regulatory domain-containing protein [uncultured Dokdonia sp.]
MKTLCIPKQQNVLKTGIALGIFLIIALCTTTVNAQETERTVTGQVTSTDGVVPSATVLLKGTYVGVVCDDDGKFTFPQKLKENDVLVVTSLGYKDREIKITGNTTYIEPFLDDIPLIIIGSLRTKATPTSSDIKKK